jgi:hypothetical protein
VLQHAGIGDGGVEAGGLSGLTTPSTPAPSNLTAATAECTANAQAEEKACPRDASGGDVAVTAAICARDWARFDAEGCGDARRAMTTCRTAQVASMDCATGEIPGCSIYLNASLQCSSAFALATGCIVSGQPAPECAGLGTYSYACPNGKAPAANCSAKPGRDSGSSAGEFCCY